MSNKYLHSDAWVLLAVIYAATERCFGATPKPAPLEDVIGYADFIEHDIVSFEQMEGALARLTQSGYLVELDSKFALTEKTVDFYHRMPKTGWTVRDALEHTRLLIGAPEWTPEEKPQSANTGVSYPSLNRASYEEALEKYYARFPRFNAAQKEAKALRIPSEG